MHINLKNQNSTIAPKIRVQKIYETQTNFIKPNWELSELTSNRSVQRHEINIVSFYPDEHSFSLNNNTLCYKIAKKASIKQVEDAPWA